MARLAVLVASSAGAQWHRVNVVVLAGTVAANPVQQRMPSGRRDHRGSRMHVISSRIGPAAVPRKTAHQQETTSNDE